MVYYLLPHFLSFPAHLTRNEIELYSPPPFTNFPSIFMGGEASVVPTLFKSRDGLLLIMIELKIKKDYFR